ncbi:MAG: hypothetical protein M1358_06275 [Chloroflexi bacterium]|nr:hypothetical protein [Chloroflexota bacterium]
MSWSKVKRLTLQFQGIYYLVTGLWPVLHRASFVALVGPKPDVFQLQSTAGLIAVIGGIITAAARAREPGWLPLMLGLGSASALGSVEIAHLRRIRCIFVLELLVELSIIALLGLGAIRGQRRKQPSK